MMTERGETMNALRGWVLVPVLSVVACAASQSSAPVYDEKADAHHDVAAAISSAENSKRNVVLIFGANWCPDCRALNTQMRKPALAALIAGNYVIVEIDLGRYTKNLDLAEQYHVPIKRGIPALAVLDSHGRLLYAMDQGQFADARSMSYESIEAFFKRWEPPR
jgi:thioredoxin 1